LGGQRRNSQAEVGEETTTLALGGHGNMDPMPKTKKRNLLLQIYQWPKPTSPPTTLSKGGKWIFLGGGVEGGI
jgi:hypothetical protein